MDLQMIPLSVAIVCASALVGVRWLFQYLDKGRVNLPAETVNRMLVELSARIRELEIHALKSDL